MDLQGYVGVSESFKRLKQVSYIFVLLMCTVATEAMAQDDVEYRMELGAGANMTAYQGDFSDALFGKMSIGGTILARAVLNPRSALRFNLMMARIKGEETNTDTYYPDLKGSGYTFNNSLYDLSATYEYNFFPYGTGKDYRGAKRITPFISMGLGLTYVHAKEGTTDYAAGDATSSSYTPTHSGSSAVITGNIPIGVGVKYKVGARWNISFDWQMHFSFSDNLDGVKDPYRIKSSGIFKNMDCYSTLTLALTYSLAPKCVTCHNDKE